jgi:hypothetical protein
MNVRVLRRVDVNRLSFVFATSSPGIITAKVAESSLRVMMKVNFNLGRARFCQAVPPPSSSSIGKGE